MGAAIVTHDIDTTLEGGDGLELREMQKVQVLNYTKCTGAIFSNVTLMIHHCVYNNLHHRRVKFSDPFAKFRQHDPKKFMFSKHC